MAETDELDNPENPLTRRLFLVIPRSVFFETLQVSRDHPAAHTTAILTPRLQLETWFEGWGPSWRKKAKQDFLRSFIDIWGDSSFVTLFHPPHSAIPASFIQRLQSDQPAELTFDQWWTLQSGVSLLEIDEAWRPS